MGNPARILVIDDDDQIRLTVTTILQDEGYSTDEARSGAEAIAKSEAGFFNLALVDLKLPDVDGVKLLPLLKETVPRMRKIMITGFPSQQARLAAHNAGADAFLAKPVNFDEFFAVIKDQLSKQEAEKTLAEGEVAVLVETEVEAPEEIL